MKLLKLFICLLVCSFASCAMNSIKTTSQNKSVHESLDNREAVITGKASPSLRYVELPIYDKGSFILTVLVKLTENFTARNGDVVRLKYNPEPWVGDIDGERKKTYLFISPPQPTQPILAKNKPDFAP